MWKANPSLKKSAEKNWTEELAKHKAAHSCTRILRTPTIGILRCQAFPTKYHVLREPKTTKYWTRNIYTPNIYHNRWNGLRMLNFK